MSEIQTLIDELDVAAGRITQYSNSPLDGLLNAAARKLEELAKSEEPVAEVVMSAAPVGGSPAWKPHKIIHASLAWLDSVPVGTKLYAPRGDK